MSFGTSRMDMPFFQELAKWLSPERINRSASNTSPINDPDPEPLAKAAAFHLKNGCPTSEVAPCLAALYFMFHEYEGYRIGRLFISLVVWGLQVVGACRGRAMWNDFYMALWQLSRSPYYVCRLHKHLKRANALQLYTANWMIRSVCQQDPEFAECWAETVRAHGEIDFSRATAETAFAGGRRR